MTTEQIKSLVNHNYPGQYTFVYEWSGYVVASNYQFGVAARKNRPRHTGTTIHKLCVSYLIGRIEGETINWFNPRLHSVSPVCACVQGQYAGHASPQHKADDVNCKKCLSKMPEIAKLPAIRITEKVERLVCSNGGFSQMANYQPE